MKTFFYKMKINFKILLTNFISNNKKKYSFLYETVLFQNISNNEFQDFVSNFDTDYLNREIWLNVTQRLVKNQEKEIQHSRHIFKGILNNLKIRSNDHIEKEVTITSSSLHSGISSAYNVTLFDDNTKYISEQMIIRFLRIIGYALNL